MGGCLGRIFNDADEAEPSQPRSSGQRRHRRSHRARSRHTSTPDDDVPLLSGDDNLAISSASSSRRHRRRHGRRSSNNGGASSSQSQQPQLQYFNSASGDPSSTDMNAEVRLAQRVGLIQQLPLIQYEEGEKQFGRECVICMIDFEPGDLLRCLPCLHSFHDQCIDQWLLKSLTCPSCLEPVDAALLATFATGWTS